MDVCAEAYVYKKIPNVGGIRNERSVGLCL